MGDRLCAWMGRLLFIILCTAGVVSGGFLLLCWQDLLDPALGTEPVQPASAPAVIPVEEDPLPAQAVLLSPEELDRAPETGAVAVIMKAGDGTLGYVSSLELAADLGVSSGDPARNAALLALNGDPDRYTVALVSCLRDGAASGVEGLGLERASGSPWLDETRTGWLDPAQPQAQSYLIGVCRELARLGFDEILLTHCCYPTQGEQTALPPAKERAETLETFCRRLRGALADCPVRLSVEGERDAGSPAPQSGQTTGLLAAFTRVWAAEENAGALAIFRPVPLPEG